ncbi:rhomboid family intramembrane serine protease [Luteolibacter sp. Populi]|uniref:rhomboid family intramembrane serine protease n=1 Tax=Luteolibacter sp. Populi TaxID=3230487 RepID=UPI003465BFC7
MRGVRYDPVRGLLQAQGPLLALITLIFAIYVLQEMKGEEWYGPMMAVPGEIVASLQHLREGNFSLADAKEFGTLVSCAFLHADPSHVIYNMLFLWIFAALAAELVGHRWVFAVFLITAITGSAFHVAINAQKFIPMLGASGAVMGFEGFYLGMSLRWHLPAPHIWPMARPVPPGQLAALGVAGVFIDYTSLMSHSASNVAYGAHLGGFVGGLVIAALAPLRPRGARSRH